MVEKRGASVRAGLVGFSDAIVANLVNSMIQYQSRCFQKLILEEFYQKQ